MPHTWGGSEAEPVAAVPPCLLPTFAAGTVLAGFVDVAMTAAFSMLGDAAIFSEEDLFRKSYGDFWSITASDTKRDTERRYWRCAPIIIWLISV